MAEKVQAISELSERTARRVSGSAEEWKSCLDTAARFYRYSFGDQLLIHAQRPDATACASMEQWNRQLRHWINPGTKGIALLRGDPKRLRLEYIFDVSDTHPVEGAKSPMLWKMRKEHSAPVVKRLEELHGPTGKGGLGSRMMKAAANAVNETYRGYLPNLKNSLTGSALEGMDDPHADAWFQSTLTASVQYTLLNRCGLDTSKHLKDSGLQDIAAFSTPAALSCLGNACAGISSELLQEIGRAVKTFDLKNEERSTEPVRPGEGQAAQTIAPKQTQEKERPSVRQALRSQEKAPRADIPRRMPVKQSVMDR